MKFHEKKIASIRPFAVVTAVICMVSTATGPRFAFADNTIAINASLLKCEYEVDPVGVDRPVPRLSWNLKSDSRGQRQTAYRILVASSLDELAKDAGDVWDSGKVVSDECIQIAYAGKPLQSSQRVFWKTQVWDADDKPSEWSSHATWTMGLMNSDDWKASWICGPGTANANPRDLNAFSYQSSLLRRQIEVKPELSRAIVNICGLGEYELSINGRRVGDSLFSPGWTKYDKTCLYDTFDVTKLIKQGKNVVGILLGNGMYNVRGGRYTKFLGSFGPQKAICQLRLEYADGSTEFVGTDASWRFRPGPITFGCIYGGEDFDARRAEKGWDLPNFDDSAWAAAEKTEGPGGILKGFSHAAPPICVQETIKPIDVKKIRPGVEVYDLGQNASYMPRLVVKGAAGDVVRVIPAELALKDGTVDRVSCGGGTAYWQYTLAGGESENWAPRFFYQGCRYLQVERTAAKKGGALPTVEALEGAVVHSSAEPVGRFECSSELFNRIHTLVRRAQRSNMMSVLTDCPHREKLGWLEQYHLNGPSLRYEFDLNRLFVKCFGDMQDSQLQNGLIPDIAPEYVVFPDGFRDSPEWGSAFILAAWQQYEWAGDVDSLRDHYEAMKRYLGYLASRSKDGVVSHGLGDWYDIGPRAPGPSQLTPIPFTATAFYYIDAATMEKIARVLNKSEDAEGFAAQSQSIRKALNEKFLRPDGQYASGSQCANAIALVTGVVPEDKREAVVEAIVRDVQSRGNSITAGDVGYRYLLRALADAGRSDVIFAMNNQSEKPGYGYQLKQGATTLTEAWDARREASQNHFMLGQIMEWFYHDLAGVGFDPKGGVGFKRIVIRPQPTGDLTWAKASYDSVRGKIISEWKITGEKLTLTIEIPPSATAEVYVPFKGDAGAIEFEEGGQERFVKAIRTAKGAAIFEVSSGRNVFQAPWAAK